MQAVISVEEINLYLKLLRSEDKELQTLGETFCMKHFSRKEMLDLCEWLDGRRSPHEDLIIGPTNLKWRNILEKIKAEKYGSNREDQGYDHEQGC